MYLHHLTLTRLSTLSLYCIFAFSNSFLLLDDGTVRNGRACRDDGNSVCESVCRMFTFFIAVFFDSIDVGDPAVLTNSRVLVDNRVLDDGAFPDTDRDFPFGKQRSTLLFGLVGIGAHNHGILDLHVFTNVGSDTDDGILHLAI